MHEGKLTFPVLYVLNSTGDEEARSYCPAGEVWYCFGG